MMMMMRSLDAVFLRIDFSPNFPPITAILPVIFSGGKPIFLVYRTIIIPILYTILAYTAIYRLQGNNSNYSINIKCEQQEVKESKHYSRNA